MKTTKILGIAVILVAIAMGFAGCGANGAGDSTSGGTKDPCAGGHSFGTWVTTIEKATKETPVGLEERNCQNCSASETRANGSFYYSLGQLGPGGGRIFYVADGKEDRPLGFTVEGYGTEGQTGYFAPYKAHYLEVAPANTTDSTWRGSATTSVLIPADTGITNGNGSVFFDAIGNGRKNTQIIIAFYADTTQSTNAVAVNNTASNRASNYTTTVDSVTYNDWFLPSLGELQLLILYRSRNAVSGMSTDTLLWSSSQNDAGFAFVQMTTNSSNYRGGAGVNWKFLSNSVRAIRAF